jgi:DNA modification methylase
VIKILEINKIYNMDCLEGLKLLDDNSIDCCVTSPPYWGLRDYGVEGQLGLESTPEEYVENMVKVFREVKRVLKEDGTLWLNLGDSYAGGGNNRGNNSPMSNKQASNKGATGQCSSHAKNIRKIEGIKRKELIGIPWMVAFALRADGWYLRQDIIWAKPNPMPESVKDRCTKSHEYIFLLTKSAQYYYDNEAIRETAKNANKTISLGEKSFSKRQAKGVGVEPSGNGKSDNYTVKEYRNKRSVWTVATKPFKGAHFAVFPPALIEPCILAGCREGGIVLDPFMGSGTTGLVAKQQNKNYIGFEMNSDYCDIANKRINDQEAQISIFKL